MSNALEAYIGQSMIVIRRFDFRCFDHFVLRLLEWHTHLSQTRRCMHSDATKALKLGPHCMPS